MRIGIFSDRYLPQTDGVSFSIETFRVELEKLGHEVFIFAPKPTWNYRERSDHVIRFNAVKGKMFFDDALVSVFFPPQALNRIQQLNLDIIHFQTPGQIGLLGAYYAIKAGVPLVTTYHTDLYEYVKHYPHVLPGTIALSLLSPIITGGGMAEYRKALSAIKPERSLDSWNQKIVVKGLTALHNHCDLVITPSLKMEHQLKSWKTESRIVTVPTGVDEITTTSHEISQFKRKYHLSPTDKIVIFVGRVGTEKNLALLIRAFDLVYAKLPDAKLLIIGEGDDMDLFKDQAGQLNSAENVVFTGLINHYKLGAAYKASSVLGFPSLTDTQGMAVNEAACSGLPIVMVDGEISEVVKDGLNGFVARNSARDFADKLIKVLSNDDLRHSMGKQSLKLASSLTATKQAVKLLRLYEETIKRHDETVGLKRKQPIANQF